MCGIAGILRFDGEKVESYLLKQMAEKLKHRGPDGEGYYVDSGQHFGLAFRRLAVIDLKTGDQPMGNEDGTIWIVFNGEIYNFRELRQELEEKGHWFKTRSDTESIIHAYEEWGAECVRHLRGMFAFAILDLREKRVFFARDRLGIKPMYYTFQNRVFAFASELKALLVLPFFSFEVDIFALVDYLRFGYVPSPLSIICGIHKLPPAHWGVVDFSQAGGSGSSLKLHRYWKSNWQVDESIPFAEWVKLLEEKLMGSVESHLISDVPLGAFLSGGTDSSSVVAFMAKLAGREKVKTFSIGYKERFFNELPYARLVVRRYGTDAVERILTSADLEDGIERLPEIFDEPFADPSALPTFQVSRLAREQVKVALSGDGGDELFGGYGRYRKILQSVERTFLRSLVRFHRSDLNPLEIFENSQRIYTDAQILEILHPKLHSFVQRSEYFQKFYEEESGRDLLSACQCIDLMTYLPENNLTKVDRASMANGLEVRVPFLDHQVVEFAVRIPSAFRLKGRQRKYILKKTMEAHLPHRVLYRKKRGFSIPLRLWMRGDFLKKVKESLLRPEMKEFFNEQGILWLLQKQAQNPRRMSQRVWALFFFSQWHKCMHFG